MVGIGFAVIVIIHEGGAELLHCDLLALGQGVD